MTDMRPSDGPSTNVIVREGRILTCGSMSVPCVIGRGGLIDAARKREGDGATPIGSWPLRRLLYRADRIVPEPETGLPCGALSPEDGWCDDPADPAYNRPVTHPYGASAEHLWREDNLYDLIVVLGHNDDPVAPGLGSAIFFHLMREDQKPTEGCVAIARDPMLAVLALVGETSRMIIEPA